MQLSWKVLVCGLVALAAQPQERKQIMIHSAEGVPPPGIAMAPQADMLQVMATGAGIFEERLVENAPYSAEGVSEFTQVLADGTRITRKNQSLLYRDSQGRTRREQTFQAIGPWGTAGEPPKSIIIHDPVAKETYFLNPGDKTARKVSAEGPSVFFKRQEDQTKDGMKQVFEREIRIEVAPSGAGAIGYQARKFPEAKAESLGSQTIEGVIAEGTRTTRTIPVGEIGNDRPIAIISERWVSPELQVTVMSKTSDPLSGETVYRLTNINRSEPAKTLFQVPADYTVKEDAGIQIQKLKVKEKNSKGVPQT